MGYANLRDRKQHEQDAARIRELEAQLKHERESHIAVEQQSAQRPATIDPSTIHVTTEKTAKKYKKRIIIGCVLFILGISKWLLNVLCFVLGLPLAAITNSPLNSSVGNLLFGLLFLTGSIILIVTKIQIWWNHG